MNIRLVNTLTDNSGVVKCGINCNILILKYNTFFNYHVSGSL